MKCPLCASGSIEPRHKGVRDFEYESSPPADFLACASCGLIFQDPMPEARLLATYYPEGYRGYLPVSGRGFLSRLKAIQTELLASTLARRLPRDGRILEIGCGNGQLLLALKRKLDGRFFGSDSSRAASAVLEQAGIELKVGDVEREFPFDGSFDAIIMNNVIEHFSAPSRVLEECRRRLSPSGTVFLLTPNADALEASIFGEYWAGFHAPRHTHVFSRVSIRRLALRSGFASCQTIAAADPGQLALSVQNVLQDHPAVRTKLKNGAAWYMPLLVAGFAPLSFLLNLTSGSEGLLCVLRGLRPEA